MKIRTDFVTNSSSSSFVLTLKFELENGEKIEWSGVADCGEGNWDYCLLAATKSPKELGECGDIESLIEMVKESIVEDYEEYDKEEATPALEDESEIIQALRKLSSIDEIKAITIEGYEDTFYNNEEGPYAKDEIVTYEMKDRKQKAICIGPAYLEDTEGKGGYLAFEHEIIEQEAPEGYFEEKRASLGHE